MLWRKIMILSIINDLVYASVCFFHQWEDLLLPAVTVTASSLVDAPWVSVAVLGFFSSASPLAKSFFEWQRGAPDAVQRQFGTRWRPGKVKKKEWITLVWMDDMRCVLELVVLTSSETGGRGMRRGFWFLHNATFIILHISFIVVLSSFTWQADSLKLTFKSLMSV